MTMEQQSAEEKSKISRSAARHLRRKRLIAARKEALKNSTSEFCISDTEKPLSKPSLESIINGKTLKSLSVCAVDSNNVEIKNVNSSRTNTKNVTELLKSKSVCKPTNIDLHCTDSNLLTASTSSSLIKQVGSNLVISKMDSQEKSREQVKAEREAKKAAKAAAKAKGKVKDKEDNQSLLQPNNVGKCNSEEKSKDGTISSDIGTKLNSLSVSTKQSTSQNVVTKAEQKTDNKHRNEEVKKTEEKLTVEEKSKAELRAERRAKQEAQRAAKQTLNEKKKQVKTAPEKGQVKPVVPVKKEEPVKKVIAKSETKDSAHEVNLFKHLYINRKKISQLVNQTDINVHPAILRLGIQYAEKVIVGSNARCIALLGALKQLIQDFKRPSQADFSRGLETSLQESINYLNSCRPTSVSMQNAVKHIKWQMTTLPSTLPDDEAKIKLAKDIDTYIQDQVLLADQAISEFTNQKISNGDVILTYGFSSLIYKILCDARINGKQFRVIIIDGRPWLEGKELLRKLVKENIECSYMLINALSFVMPQVTKVILGAHAILANGAVMSRVGTAQVALIANAFNVPVLVTCETHKSCERVQTDSIVYNEIGDPDQLVKDTCGNSKKSCLSNWKTRKTLNLLNITYDVTPANLVTAVVTELAILPCTSVPVILRIKPTEI